MAEEYSFGEWIRKRRRALGLTQAALAEQVGYSAAMLRKIESDERRPAPDGAALLAAALEIPPDQQEAFLQVARQERPVDRLGSVDDSELYPWQALPRPQTNLPVPATLFVGREKELAGLARQLGDPACRLLTLAGLAGIGKTRLALQAAHNELEHFADGVFFVPLAPLCAPETIVAAIASAIGLQFSGPVEPRKQLLRYLQGKQMLLLLDNFEHLIEGASLLSAIVQAAPEVKLLVTSRERLNLQGEWVVEVEGLPYPSGQKERSLERVETYDAVQLFTQGALRVDPSFRLSAENRAWVVRICELLEGIPLGIELAAAWVRLLSCQQIAQEVESNLDFLTTSSRDLPERHRSLRAALDHSWNLLSAKEKAALRRLSVFRGGFRREAAQAVADAGLDELASLLDKSLLRRVGDERYDLHEMVRQYAATHLQAEAAEDAETQDRHSRYYVSLLANWAGGIRGGAQKQVLAEMDLELENVRLAWRRIVAQHELEEIRRSLRSLRNFFEVRARFQEGAELFHEAVAVLEAASDTDRDRADEHAIVLGQLLAREGYFQAHLDRYQVAGRLLQQSLALLRGSGDRAALADTLAVLGYMHSRLGGFAEARQYAGESLELNRAIGNPIGTVFCLLTLAHVCVAEGAFEQAYALSMESLQISREGEGDPHGTTDSLIVLSAAARHLGKYDEAKQWAEEGVRISRMLDDRWCLAQTLRQLGLVHLALEEKGRADTLLRQSTAHARETGDRMLLASVLVGLGLVQRAMMANGRANEHFLQALQTAIESRTVPVALQALAELATGAMEEGESELALALATYGRQHGLASARLNARWDEVHAALAAQFTPEQMAEIEERARSWTLEQVAQELEGRLAAEVMRAV